MPLLALRVRSTRLRCAARRPPPPSRHLTRPAPPSPRLQRRAREGTLARLTAPDLKKYLKAHGLRVGGAKAELVARVEEHLTLGGQGAA